MPVQRDADGRRYVQVETEAPGTPEEVWQAIATGPGISSWFVPTELEERAGGVTTSHFGPGMDSRATITQWEPPHRFVAEAEDELGPDGPPVATEWVVEARDGGSCVVRVVHSWFTSSDEWDEQFEGHTYGWLSVFRILRLYLAHFPGQPGVLIQTMGVAPEPKEEAWAALMAALGLPDANVGDRVQTAEGAPTLAGVVEWAGQPAWPEELLVRLDEPAPGIAMLVLHPMDGRVYLTARIFLYGERADEIAAREAPTWQTWMHERFAMPEPAAEAV